jgi:hypothetical protein
MLKEKQMQDIKDLKLQGYTISEISQHYTENGLKPPSLPTIRKYFQMDVLPETPNENLQKDKAFDHEPFRSAILAILFNNKDKKNVCMSSVVNRQILFPRKALFQSNKIKMLLKQPALFSGRLF